jgi:hypothetical protein
MRYSGPRVGSDEVAAQEKQGRWHKLHIYLGRIPDISSRPKPLQSMVLTDAVAVLWLLGRSIDLFPANQSWLNFIA